MKYTNEKKPIFDIYHAKNHSRLLKENSELLIIFVLFFFILQINIFTL